MRKPKLKLDQVWPDRKAGAKRVPEDAAESPVKHEELTAELAQLRLVCDQSPTRTSRPRGSFYLRRGWSLIVRSVYLTRVLEKLEQGYKEGGERFLSSLALVWVSNDGSREFALKGRALRELVLDMR